MAIKGGCKEKWTLKMWWRNLLNIVLIVNCVPGAACAKLVAQKSKGMPRISISLTRLTGSAANEAMAKLSLELFTAFRSMQTLMVQGIILISYVNNSSFYVWLLFLMVFSVDIFALHPSISYFCSSLWAVKLLEICNVRNKYQQFLEVVSWLILKR